jgi:hypothetical protein
MTAAAHVGIAARKNAGASMFELPITVAPIGTGTPVTTQLAMHGSSTQYTGSAQAQTTTQLPPGGNLDPTQMAKTIGVAAVAHHAFTPVGRAATGIVMHRKRQEEKKAASGPLPDVVNLTVTADLANGRIHEIRGAQTDNITLEGKPVDVQSTWAFTRQSP